MGYFLGQKMPDYNPFWEESAYADQPDYWKWYHLGYDDGYQEGEYKIMEDNALAEENSSLRALLAANVRVIKEELRKEIEQENKTSDEQARTSGNR